MRTAFPLLVLLSLTAGCDGDETSPEPGADPKPKKASFEREAEPNGPRLWLDGARGADGRLRIQVYGAELGQVFGWAAHVRYDAGAFAVETGALTETLGQTTEAARFVSLAEGDAALGEARRGAALGGAAIDEPTVLAVLEIGEPEATSDVALDRVMVRRADGSWVEVATAGGVLTEGGAL